MKKIKKILSLILIMCSILTTVPVFAAEVQDSYEPYSSFTFEASTFEDGEEFEHPNSSGVTPVSYRQTDVVSIDKSMELNAGTYQLLVNFDAFSSTVGNSYNDYLYINYEVNYFPYVSINESKFYLDYDENGNNTTVEFTTEGGYNNITFGLEYELTVNSSVKKNSGTIWVGSVTTPDINISLYKKSTTTTITQDDVANDTVSVEEIEVTAEQDDSFIVQVPILTTISTQNWNKVKYGTYYWSSAVNHKSDLASNKRLDVSVNEIIVFTPEGGLKNDVEWKAYMLNEYNDIAIKNGKGFYTEEVMYKPNKNMTAGLWRGFAHINVEIKEQGVILTKEQFAQYIENDTTVTSITIPKYIEVEGIRTLISGVGFKCFEDFSNLTDIYLETDDRFKFNNVFLHKSVAGGKTVTIHGNDNLVLINDGSHYDGIVTYDNCKLSILTSLTITKISDNTVAKESARSGVTDGTYTKSTNGQRARTLEVIELDPTKTYKVSLNGIAADYWYGILGWNSTESSKYDSGWIASATETTVTGLESIVLNFAYGSGRTTTMTMEHIAEITKYLTITEVTE